jgi:hypothetical protein
MDYKIYSFCEERENSLSLWPFSVLMQTLSKTLKRLASPAAAIKAPQHRLTIKGLIAGR